MMTLSNNLKPLLLTFSEDCEHLLDALYFTDSPAPPFSVEEVVLQQWKAKCKPLGPDGILGQN
jgi:hypothetical protein